MGEDDKKRWDSGLSSLEDIQDQREKNIIQGEIKELTTELDKYQSDIFGEIVKNTHFSSEKWSQTLQKTIKNILESKKYLENTSSYQKYKTFFSSREDIKDGYIQVLQDIFTEWLSNEQIDDIVKNYQKFLSKYRNELFPKDIVDVNLSDKENFLAGTGKIKAPFYDIAKVSIFLDKLLPAFEKKEIYAIQMGGEKNLYANLSRMDEYASEITDTIKELKQNFMDAEITNTLNDEEKKQIQEQAIAKFGKDHKQEIDEDKISLSDIERYINTKKQK